MNDELAWVLQAQQGNDEAFTKLVEEHQTHVYNLCYRMLGEPEAAEDAAQETFLRAYQNLHRYDRSRSFATGASLMGPSSADAEELIASVGPGEESKLENAQRRAEELGRRDHLFPNIIPAIAAALGGSRSLVVG